MKSQDFFEIFHIKNTMIKNNNQHISQKILQFVKYIDFYTKIAYYNFAGRDTLYTCESELTFKRYVISSDTGLPLWQFFFVQIKGII